MIHHLRTLKLAAKEFGTLLILLGTVYAGFLVAWAHTLPKVPQ